MTKLLFSSITKPMNRDCSDLTKYSSSEHIYSHLTTNAQDPFGPRSQLNHWTHDLIAYNVNAESVVLHYPTQRRLEREIKKFKPDYFLMHVNTPTFERAENMARRIKKLFPGIKIVYGGYSPEDADNCEADIVIRGEGVAGVRKLIGEEPREIIHPEFYIQYSLLNLGLGLCGVALQKGGCDVGCEFCSTYAYFDGQVAYLLDSDGLCDLTSKYVKAGAKDLLIMDENFLGNKKGNQPFFNHVRSLEQLINTITCFGCMKHVQQYSPEELFDLGIHVWTGIEDFSEQYAKNDYKSIANHFENMHQHGIKVIASTIIGGPHQTMADFRATIDKALALKAYTYQWNILTPFEGTKLNKKVEIADRRHKNRDGHHLIHKHPTATKAEIESLQRQAAQREYFELGPSVIRALEITWNGRNTFKKSKVKRIQQRIENIEKTLKRALPLVDYAILKHKNPDVRERLRDFKGDVISEIGTPDWYLPKRLALIGLGEFESARTSLEKMFPRPLMRQPKFKMNYYPGKSS